MFDQLALGAPSAWYLPTAIIAAVMLVLILLAYRFGFASRQIKLLAGLLKLLAIIGLAICILEPLRRGKRPRPHANVIGVMVDNSNSMQLRTSGTQSNGDQLKELLDSKSSWRTRLEQEFDLRTYAFDSRISNVDDFSKMAFDGKASALGQALDTIHARFKDRPVAGLLLFTDGNSTDVVRQDWSNLGFPIYPVFDQRPNRRTDVRLSQVTVAQTDFETAPVTIQSAVLSEGLAGHEVLVTLKDEAGNVVEQQEHTLLEDDEPVNVRFQFKPDQSGVQFYSLEAQLQHKGATFKAPIEELTAANNQHLISVSREQGPYRVLYVAGRPNWEFKFLRRALAEEEEVQLVGLLRIARKEPKFSFRDRGVTSENTLFKGFDNKDEETTEQYDEPVLLRLGVNEEDELSSGFPKTSEELFRYQAVIIDDVEASFFTQDQMLMLRRFVSERGGGMLLLGGQETLEKGGYRHTPLGDIAPVYLSENQSPSREGETFRLDLTREGWLESWLRLRSTEQAEKKRLADVVPFATLNVPGRVKPGATMLASVKTANNPNSPALVVQRFGKGRGAALMVGDLWRWGMRRSSDDQDDLAQLWRQTIRWLVNDVDRRVKVDVQTDDDYTKPARISVTVRDEDYKPLDNARVELSITSPDHDEPYEIVAQASAQKSGVYETEFWARSDGAYKLKARVTADDRSLVDQPRSVGWTSQPTLKEFQTLAPNRELLQQLADQTGGEVISKDRLDEFVTSLPSRKVPITEDWVYPVWHRPWVLMLIVGCLCGEWALRRLNGMP